jgi:thiamine-monophosphate kinase
LSRSSGRPVKLREIGEFGLIARIRSQIANPPSNVVKGIGDDCAVSTISHGNRLVTTTDLLVEGIHFDLSFLTASELGRKSLAVNLSDIAAMGARPRFAFLSLAIPDRLSVEFLDGFLKGFLDFAAIHGVSLLGGDTSASPDRFFINVTLLGEGKGKSLVFRHGAKPGDDLYVTGTIGDSLLGLQIGKQKKKKALSPEETFLLNRHLNPTPRVREGRIFAEKKLAHAMIDLSDGLLSDLGHICEESHVGATIYSHRLPLSDPLKVQTARIGASGWKIALRGGEDYELLFSASPKKGPGILALGRKWPCGVTWIGTIEPQNKGIVIQGMQGPVDAANFRGYDHFAGMPEKSVKKSSKTG